MDREELWLVGVWGSGGVYLLGLLFLVIIWFCGGRLVIEGIGGLG